MVISDAESEKPRPAIADRFDCLFDNGAARRDETVLVIDDGDEQLPAKEMLAALGYEPVRFTRPTLRWRPPGDTEKV